MKAQILLVDDDSSLLRLISMRLQAIGYHVVCAESGEQALSILSAAMPQLVITDLRMEGMDGMELFRAIQKKNPSLPVIILTAHGSIPEAVQATQKGVFSFLTKPLNKDDLAKTVASALRMSNDGETDTEEQWCADIITRNPKMMQLLVQAKMVSEAEVNVLLQGQSGTGKEVFAKAIHQASPRRKAPFVAINCGALPEHLLESELFGHVKGAFTGATTSHKGLFQAAEGGTLFLDEIGDMPLPLQVKLLRVLQEKSIRPVGSTQNTPIDVRIISATHHDLEMNMKSGEFREDLYYRLNVVNFNLPSLNERQEDIPLLANHFLEIIAAKQKQPAKRFAPDAMDMMISAPWPGNVRQLFNVVEQTTALCRTQVIPENLVATALNSFSEEMPSLTDARNQFERDYVIKLLRISNGNISQAARLAKRNRTDFYKIMSRHGIEHNHFKSM